MGTQEGSLTRVKGMKSSGIACPQFAISSFCLIGAYNEGYVDAKDAAK